MSDGELGLGFTQQQLAENRLGKLTVDQYPPFVWQLLALSALALLVYWLARWTSRHRSDRAQWVAGALATSLCLVPAFLVVSDLGSALLDRVEARACSLKSLVEVRGSPWGLGIFYLEAGPRELRVHGGSLRLPLLLHRGVAALPTGLQAQMARKSRVHGGIRALFTGLRGDQNTPVTLTQCSEQGASDNLSPVLFRE